MRAFVAAALALAIPASGAASASADGLANGDRAVVDEGQLSDMAMPYVEADSLAEAEPMLDAIAAQMENGTSAEVAAKSVGATTLAAKPAPCVLHPSVVYKRTSSGKRAVGFKPYTTCDVFVSKIRHTAELRYQYYLTWKTAQKKPGGNSTSKSYTQRNIEFYCKDLKTSTLFRGATTGQIVYNGKSYYSQVITKTARHDCRA